MTLQYGHVVLSLPAESGRVLVSFANALDNVLRPVIDAGYTRNDTKHSAGKTVPARPHRKAGGAATGPNPPAAAAAHQPRSGR